MALESCPYSNKTPNLATLIRCNVVMKRNSSNKSLHLHSRKIVLLYFITVDNLKK